MKKLLCGLVMLVMINPKILAQQQDSISTRILDSVLIRDTRISTFLPDTEGVNLYAGKKTNSIDLGDGSANLPQNVGRTIFSKIPGVHIWDMDGAGTQMNISTRGTDAHRSIEMNMRQNGYNTNSDMFGYPENHYTVPMQGVKQVQLVRGSAALQFGSQFGGMMNYVMKDGEGSKPFFIESEQTVGSYNFFNSYNAIGGSNGKVSYYAYYDNRHGDGWRPNSAYKYQAFYANLKYRFNDRGSLSFQFSRMDYTQQIAGGLTDAMFNANPQQSNRTRNFFRPVINVPAITFDYDFNPKTHLQIMANGIWGERSSVQYINTANVNDTINTAIKSYNPRQVDRDFYTGVTLETRLLHKYALGSMNGVLAGGLRLSRTATDRRQRGRGTTGADPDMSLVAPYGIDLEFATNNVALFVENQFKITDAFSVTPGIRYELIDSELTGVINNRTFPVAYTGNRSFPLFGVGAQYQVSRGTQLYANISQAYRPYLYASITPADQIGVIDPNLKDSKGYNIDAGYRGTVGDILKFDVNGFYVFYGDKIGRLTQLNPENSTYQLTTNIGNSVHKGVEAFMNLSLLKAFGGTSTDNDISIFTSLAYTHARYVTGSLSNNTENISIVDNMVENVPAWNNRYGLELKLKGLRSTFQVTHVSEQFSDANNTTFVTTGAVGVIPAYAVCDWSFNYEFLKSYHIGGGVNNLTDAVYFSRRINMYPGPGILPGDGRTVYVTVGAKF
ncbi:MAG TPA: TonB-dependent receptor [Cyclobacteriaceae bacterium]|nr:TonB-dependent receptor [Cyclobacteriaceae bacterium]